MSAWGQGQPSGQGAGAERPQISSTGNILSPPALTLRAKSGHFPGRFIFSRVFCFDQIRPLAIL
jgi:hypothetical protein